MNKRIAIFGAAVVFVALVATYFVVLPYFQFQGRTLRLQFETLPVLTKGHYEGWALFGDEKVSTGKFLVAKSGDITSLSGGVMDAFHSDRDLGEADAIAITIEPEGDSDSSPSGIVILLGQVSNGRAELTFPLDLSGSTVQYVLATPTNGEEPKSEETSGVWFPDLKLPQAPSGWKYEGWAVTGETVLSTGRFANPNSPDEFSGYNGPETPPQIPGEDFLRNPPQGISFPIELANGKGVVAITIEPDLNGVDPTGPQPFELKPFVAQVPSGAPDHQPIPIPVDLSSIPSGIASIS